MSSSQNSFYQVDLKNLQLGEHFREASIPHGRPHEFIVAIYFVDFVDELFYTN